MNELVADKTALIATTLSLIIVLPGLLYAVRQGGAMRNALIWLALLTLLVLGYNIFQRTQHPEVTDDAPASSAPPASDEPAPVRTI